MRAKRRDSGFSLLEIIVVLAIAGIALTFYAAYARKEANRVARENIATATVQEMKGVMTFVLDPEADSDVGIGDDDTAGNPLYIDDSSVDTMYHRRITNRSNDKDTGAKSEYFLWGDGANNAKQQRYLFISKNCTSTLKSEYEFAKEFLSCSLSSAAKNSAAFLERVGFYAPVDDTEKADDSLAINRTDIFVAFNSDTKRSRLSFVDYYPQFSKAMTNSGLVLGRAVIVHRSSSTANWQLVMKTNDPQSPVEFLDAANNVGALSAYTTGQFGVRFSFNMSDNEQGSSSTDGAGEMCWNSGADDDKKITLCYDKAAGTGAHGEEQIVALNMTDKSNPRGDQMAGTLKANLVMENTARPVYIFKRKYGGDLELDSEGVPVQFTYTDDDGQPYYGDFYFGTRASITTWDGSSVVASYNTFSDYYRTAAYDGYELITPSTTEYSGFELWPINITDDSSYTPDYDDADQLSGRHRFAVQTCPKVEQNIILRDAEGNPLLDDDGNIRKATVTRELYPHLAASIASVSAYSNGGRSDIYTRPDKTRTMLKSDQIVDLLGGVTVQVELALQDTNESTIRNDANAGEKSIFPNAKYVWIVTSTMGMYDSETGKGVNIVNPNSIAYTITKWCSSVPQSGTFADLLSTTKYESTMDED